MLSNATKIIGMIVLAIVLCGCGYKVYADSQVEYRTVFFCERLKTNDRFNDIVGHYYNGDIQGESWDEYQTRMKERNYFLFHKEDGTPKSPQPGEYVIVECRIVIKK